MWTTFRLKATWLLCLLALEIGFEHVQADSTPNLAPVSAWQNGKRSGPVTFPLKKRRPSNLSTPEARSEGADTSAAAKVDLATLKAIRDHDLARAQSLLAHRSSQKSEKERRGSWETQAMSSWYGDVFYYISVEMGNPPQRLDISVDTGSSDLWVQSSTCRSCNLSIVQPYLDGSEASFDASRSSSFVGTNEQVHLRYVDGSELLGTVASDTVTIGQFSVPNQTFVLATAQSGQFSSAGLLGLAWQPLARTGENPWWLNALDQFDQPEMSFYFAQWTDQRGVVVQEGGQFTLGGRNATLYDGDINFIPILDNIWWTVPFQSIVVSSNTTLNLSGDYGAAVVDTGTTLILGPDEVVNAFYQAIPGTLPAGRIDPELDGFWAIPCDTTVNPDFRFSDNASFPLLATNLVWQGIEAFRPGYCLGSVYGYSGLATSRAPEPTITIPGAPPTTLSEPQLPTPTSPQPTPVTDPQWLLGDVFLKSVYTVFRHGDASRGEAPSVGFARLKGVNYATDGLAVLGLNGNGVNGRIGHAGNRIAGGANGTSSQGTLQTIVDNGITRTTMVFGQQTQDPQSSSQSGAAVRGYGRLWEGWVLVLVLASLFGTVMW
ncbi:acid protease [Serendipita vermifera]|nr:acid protease [Serendipita vermifera]